MNKLDLLILRLGEGRPFSVAGRNVTIKVTAASTGNAWSVVEYHMPPHDSGTLPHWHQQRTEMFYVLAGTATFRLDHRVFLAETGALDPDSTRRCA